MKTIEVKVYEFAELSEKAKQKAIERFSDINVNFEWWENTYEDAANIGLKIKGFDIDRGSYVKGEFTLAANEVAQNILNEHGETCETYKTAQNFMNDWQTVLANYMDETHEDYESSESEESLLEIEEEFLRSLCEDYRIILQNEYEYQTSEAAIIEGIEANEYDFTEDGTLF
jgi:hypothetical protein